MSLDVDLILDSTFFPGYDHLFTSYLQRISRSDTRFFIFILLFLYIFLGFVRTLLAVFNLFLVFLSWVKIFLHFLTPSDFLKLFFLLFLTFWNRFWTILNPLGLGFFVIDPFLLIIACLSPGYQFLTLFHFSFTFLAFFDRFKFFWPLFKVLFI